ncbi:hypothetical protein [Schlesneria paludicola]|uniref:hypothetical protein n=1 Tax=Schlesneria paludicola TaxID=360056 RepID=UPI00029A917C|nr:hypothetical protein [Schlesneria paludicola]
MAQAYTPGLMVSRGCRWRCRRLLPIAGDVPVKVGDVVSSQDVVARTFMPGDAVPVNLAKRLGVSASELSRSMLRPVGETVVLGETLARTKGFFGFFKSEFPSPMAGTIESISKVTGQVILRGEPIAVQVLAYINGTIVEVIPHEGVVVESDVALVQGIFGVGGEAFGKIAPVVPSPDDDLTAQVINPEHRGCVVVGGRRVTGDAVRRAIEVGVSAVVAGGIDDHDLRQILGYDLGVAVTGTEKLGTTIIVTEGFGEIAMAKRTFDLLIAHRGREASVNGATQIRAGVMRPEIVIPLAEPLPPDRRDAGRVAGALDLGSPIRIIREPYFGALGSVTRLPHEQVLLASESLARVVEVKLADGSNVTVPRANVELIEG